MKLQQYHYYPVFLSPPYFKSGVAPENIEGGPTIFKIFHCSSFLDERAERTENFQLLCLKTFEHPKNEKQIFLGESIFFQNKNYGFFSIHSANSVFYIRYGDAVPVKGPMCLKIPYNRLSANIIQLHQQFFSWSTVIFLMFWGCLEAEQSPPNVFGEW
eukprot:TRINITY_DN1701_c0_g2_i1.p1 TRINITY_DN1701_c0_g2~~TRINITY_DN1701_c0_g2_i1.p1  ORF type:complete len:183 (+),score=14.13 TRINITY_DN1701_c0_g2_i1:77-550(+)